MKVEELRGRAVVSVQQAEKLGAIDDVLVDLQAHQIGGLLLQGGLFRGGPIVSWSAVHSVGPDAAMVDDSSAVAGTVSEAPAHLVRLATLRGRKVVTDAGELAGTLANLDFDPETGRILSYTVAEPASGLFSSGAQFSLPPQAVEGVGQDLITVDAKQVDAQRRPQR